MQKCKVAKQTKTEWIIDQLYIQPPYSLQYPSKKLLPQKKEKHSCCSIPSIIYFDHLEKKWIGTEEKEVVLLHFD